MTVMYVVMYAMSMHGYLTTALATLLTSSLVVIMIPASSVGDSLPKTGTVTDNMLVYSPSPARIYIPLLVMSNIHEATPYTCTYMVTEDQV